MTELGIWCNEDKEAIVGELTKIGCCDFCILRYLGVKYSEIYRDPVSVAKIIGKTIDNNAKDHNNGGTEEGSEAKRSKISPCTACLGLLQTGTEPENLNKIVKEVMDSKIESSSYFISLSTPISIQIRAYSIWFYLSQKFPQIYEPLKEFKPEGISMKSVWKWIVTDYLKNEIQPEAEWHSNDGKLSVQISPFYIDEELECRPIDKFITQDGRIQLKKGRVAVSRQSVETLLSTMQPDKYFQLFESPPSNPKNSITIGRVQCSHAAIYIAGRYCKYSRTLSQTPWFIDGVKKTETSVEELISTHIMSLTGADESKFSSSGREDVDVRTLGRGRPFVFELINPRRTILTKEKMRSLEETINKSTTLISVRDLQVVNKKDLNILKDGEESKTKTYTALCVAPLVEKIEQKHLDLLNSTPLPLILQQKTPLRVMHRRTVAVRERSILELKASLVVHSSSSSTKENLFTLRLKTQAGTYVKEFVHGDLGRTSPNVSSILGFEADIIALDVEGVDVDWPPQLDYDDTTNTNSNEKNGEKLGD